MSKNFLPLAEAGLVDTVDGSVELLDGITLLPTPGHTPFHQSVLFDGGGERALFLADLCPTSAHLPLPWIMGYDLEPLVTLETKRALWERVRAEDWILVFQHDVSVPWGRMDVEDGKVILNPID
jgi:glyoxylase-like metal-dependent hydrolase (beta-lactamase superfamily II)